MSTELVTLNEPLDLALPSTGLEDLVRIRPTNVILVQNTTQEPGAARAGQFLDVLTGEVYDDLTVVALQVSLSRVLFPPGNTFGQDPLCRSSNGRFPSPSVETPQAEECASCSYSRWRGKQPPSCKERIQFTVVLKANMLPRYMQFGGVSVKPAKELLENIMQRKIVINQTEGRLLDLYDFEFKVSSRKIVNEKGVFFAARFTDLKVIDDRGTFGPLFQKYVALPVSETSYDDAEVNDKINNVIDTSGVQV